MTRNECRYSGIVFACIAMVFYILLAITGYPVCLVMALLSNIIQAYCHYELCKINKKEREKALAPEV